MATPLTQAPFIYQGVRFHGRAFALAAFYSSFWRPPADSVWIEHPHVTNCWTHDNFPKQVLWKPADDLVVTTHLASSTPDESKARQLGRVALGATAAPFQIASYPLVVRLPMRGPGMLALPSGGFRNRRLWPLVGEPAQLENVCGLAVEFRVSGSSTPRGVRVSVDAFVGGAYENKRHLPRSLIFPSDARRVFVEPNPQRLKSFTANLMDRLLAFAYFRGDQGLEVDRRVLSGRRLGRVQICKDIDDVEFAIRLPQPAGLVSYIGSYITL